MAAAGQGVRVSGPGEWEEKARRVGVGSVRAGWPLKGTKVVHLDDLS